MTKKILVLVVVLAAAALAYTFLPAAGPGPGPAAAGADAGTDDVTDEAERKAYLSSYVEVADLKLEPDQRPDDAGVVPGLLAASGVVSNKGARGLRSLRVQILTQDQADNVLGAYVEDVLSGQRLGPGESKAFRFTVPAKPGWGGRFRHALK